MTENPPEQTVRDFLEACTAPASDEGQDAIENTDTCRCPDPALSSAGAPVRSRKRVCHVLACALVP